MFTPQFKKGDKVVIKTSAEDSPEFNFNAYYGSLFTEGNAYTVTYVDKNDSMYTYKLTTNRTKGNATWVLTKHCFPFATPGVDCVF